MEIMNRYTQANDDPQLIALLEKLIKQYNAAPRQRDASAKQKARRRIALQESYGEGQADADVRLERIIQGNDLTDINYLAVGLIRARAVGRVVVRENGRTLGYGTGFLVAPGVLLTNQHVLETVAMVRDSIVQFRFERDAGGNDLTPVEFAFRTDPTPIIDASLDIALVRVESISTTGETLDSFGWLQLNPTPGKAFLGEYLTIIQHPQGERKQVCVRENRLLKFEDNSPFIWYQTDTSGGSSGSPVFNNAWDVVALHHKGVPRTREQNGKYVWLTKDGTVWREEMGDEAVDWIANEGVRVSRIVGFLADQFGNHPLSLEVRQIGSMPLKESLLVPDVGDSRSGVRVTSDFYGNTRVFLPIELGIKLGIAGATSPKASIVGQPSGPHTSSGNEPLVGSRGPGTFGPKASRGPGTFGPSASSVATTEAVTVDQTNYAKRNGYDPKFLGSGLVVPLPKLTTGMKAVKVSGQKTELKYWNYSVVMNAERRLAFFSAANIDASLFRGERDKAGDKWYTDDRIDEALQVGKEFYKKQREFEADRTKNPFDQGHLTSRGNLQWGSTEQIAKRNGDDSFHYTNCAPQHWAFNQNNKQNGLWFRLEVSAIETLSAGNRLCIINGPIFDAPRSKRGADGRLHLDLTGRSAPDSRFGGVKIPKLFFKLFAYNDGGKLAAKAFVVSQEDLLKNVDRMYEEEAAVLTDAEIALYQVKISDLEAVTGLRFGIPASKDQFEAEELIIAGEGRLIESEDEFFGG